MKENTSFTMIYHSAQLVNEYILCILFNYFKLVILSLHGLSCSVYFSIQNQLIDVSRSCAMNYYGHTCIKTRLVHNMLSLFHKLYLDINNKFKLKIFDIHLIFFSE